MHRSVSLRLIAIICATWLLPLFPSPGVAQTTDASPAETSNDRSHQIPRHGPRERIDSPHWRGSWRGDRVRSYQQQLRKPIDSGYLFIDGKYQRPPYALDWHNNQLQVNGQPTGITEEQLPGSESGQRRNSNAGRFINNASDLWKLTSVATGLNHDELVLLYSDAPPLVLHSFNGGMDVLRALSDPAEQSALLASDLEGISPNVNREQLQAWLAGFTPPQSLADRAAQEVSSIEKVIATNQAQTLAVQRYDQWAYLLTIAGMVLVVAAFGHLLSSAPAAAGKAEADRTSPEAIRALVWSLALVAALSSLDLVWTLLSSQAGVMRELNPLAKGLIDDPYLLTAFKGAMTVLALGVLLALRRYRPAQVGAWWACLICTLLTARWLMFNSLMV